MIAASGCQLGLDLQPQNLQDGLLERDLGLDVGQLEFKQFHFFFVGHWPLQMCPPRVATTNKAAATIIMNSSSMTGYSERDICFAIDRNDLGTLALGLGVGLDVAVYGSLLLLLV